MNVDWHEALVPRWGTLFSSDLRNHFVLVREGDATTESVATPAEPEQVGTPETAASAASATPPTAGPPPAPDLAIVRLAAEQGDARAQHYLGALYASGTGGVAQDSQAAAVCYLKAAEQGLAIAQNNLGFLYATGQGVAADYVAAYMWIHLAMANGYAEATRNLAILSKHMTPAQIEQGRQRADEWVAQRART
ncbi:MAG: sel1 repeat family protein [Magnetococcus sp. DMHC-8]